MSQNYIISGLLYTSIAGAAIGFGITRMIFRDITQQDGINALIGGCLVMNGIYLYKITSRINNL